MNLFVWNNIGIATTGLTGLTFDLLQRVFNFQRMVYKKHEYYLKRGS
jgi:hypothetical protein